MCQGIAEIKGWVKISEMPMPMLKEIVKGEVQAGVEESRFRGFSMDYFLHHLLVPVQMEMLKDLANVTIPDNSREGLLGVADAKNSFNKFVDVEFDTFANPWDTHILELVPTHYIRPK
ncbi:putative bark agglutinin LECRPA3 [Trifolium repens]|nr:putative bark agglutinin LECRPA3 [Trifolium repens]